MTFTTHSRALASATTARPTRALRSLGLALALTVGGGAVVAFPARDALAGTAQFHDPMNMLDEAARTRVRSAATPLPFDVRVLVANTPDVSSLTQQAQGALTSSNQLAIAIDPANRRTAVRAGNGVNIPTQRLSMLADAGNPFFRVGDYAGGLNAIAQYASASVVGAPTGSPFSRRSRVDSRSSSGAPIGIIVIVGVVALVFGALALARRRSGPGFANNAGFGGYRTNDAPAPYGPAYGNAGYPPAYGGGYAAPGAGIGSAVGAGVAGAALGGLAGYALGRSGEHHDQPSNGTFGNNDDSNAGSGGGGDAARWDDGGGGGGGGGDFGGGGGGDAGGWD